jgi:hypothetical protein
MGFVACLKSWTLKADLSAPSLETAPRPLKFSKSLAKLGNKAHAFSCSSLSINVGLAGCGGDWLEGALCSEEDSVVCADGSAPPWTGFLVASISLVVVSTGCCGFFTGSFSTVGGVAFSGDLGFPWTGLFAASISSLTARPRKRVPSLGRSDDGGCGSGGWCGRGAVAGADLGEEGVGTRKELRGSRSGRR